MEFDKLEHFQIFEQEVKANKNLKKKRFDL